MPDGAPHNEDVFRDLINFAASSTVVSDFMIRATPDPGHGTRDGTRIDDALFLCLAILAAGW